MARLVALASENEWAIDGYAAGHGMGELWDMTTRRFCNFVRWWATRNAGSEAELAKFERQLWLPPPGEEPKGPWAAEAENAGLSSLKTSLGK